MVRRENPQLAAFVDAIKEAFPGARVSYLRHHEQAIGIPMSGTDIFPSLDPVMVREVEREMKERESKSSQRAVCIAAEELAVD